MSSIKDKIRKLLALAESDNEHEAAQALARAQSLMSENEIREEDLGDAVFEKIEDIAMGESRSGRLPSWRKALMGACSHHNGCSHYIRSSMGYRTLHVVGRPSDVARAQHIYRECVHVIDRLAKTHGRGRGRGFAAAFRYGVVNAIAQEMKEERARMAAELQGQVSETALVVIDTRAKDAQKWTRENLRLRSVAGPRLDAHGLSHGRDRGAGAYGQAARTKLGAADRRQLR